MRQPTDLICIGMALVDCLIRGFDPTPVSASGYRAESCTLSVGGEAVNAACAVAKLGVRTGIVCALGQDAAGQMVEAELVRNGVNTEGVYRPADYATPVTTMFVKEDGSRQSVTNRAHAYNFHPEREPERFTGARAVLLGSLFRAPFDDPEVVTEVLRQAHAAGALVFADTKLPNFRKLTLADLREALPLIQTITPNEDEARYFTGKEEPEEMADVLLGYGVRNVIIKLGAQGCYLKNAHGSVRLPAYPVKAVDATGAGDNLVAGYVSEILRGKTPEEALAFGNACGAICATAVGAGAGLKNREQVLELMKKGRC